jgi:hypothetical protein
MSQVESFECRSCGASLTIEGEALEVQCPFCGKVNIVPEALRPKPVAPAEHPEGTQIVINVPESVRERIEAARNLTPPVARPRRRSGGCGAVLVFFIIVAIAVVVGNLNNPVVKQLIGPTATATPPPINRPLAGSLPRKARYAGLEISVTSATISNENPSGRGEPRRYSSDHVWAYLDLAINNTYTRPVNLYQGDIRLKLSDGVSYDEVSGFADGFDAQATKSEKLIFAVPINSTWDGASLVVAQSGKEPAVLPLTGPASAAPFPVKLTAGGKATAQQIDYQVLVATLDLDALGERADLGQRFLILTLRMTNHNPAPGGTDIGSNSFRLLVDGVAVAPVDAPIENLAPQSALDRSVSFTLPASAKQVVLQVGDVTSGATATIPISLKAATP